MSFKLSSFGPLGWITLGASLLNAAPLAHAGDAPSARIVGGDLSRTCHFPSATLIFRQGKPSCTGTLVHPEIVTTAAHCVGSDMSFGFGEKGQYSKVTGVCKRNPDKGDTAYCKLHRPVTTVPITPILMGCELDALMPETPVTLVGFGLTSFEGSDFGVKRQVHTPVFKEIGQGGQSNEPIFEHEILVGDAETGACKGDSGGPAYIDLREHEAFADKPGAGWRVFGITSRKGPGGKPCASTSVYGVISTLVPWIEQDSGIDITPCFDSDGSWNPGPKCTQFPNALAGGSWPSCAAEPGQASATCGTAYGASTNSTGDTDSSNTTSSDLGSGANQDDEGPARRRRPGCSLHPLRQPGLAGAALLVLVAGLRRRKHDNA